MKYKGYFFESELAYRYAVLLDILGVRWEYKPKSFQTKHGTFVPDFLLHGLKGCEMSGGKLWIVIKEETNYKDSDKLNDFIYSDGIVEIKNPTLIVDALPDDDFDCNNLDDWLLDKDEKELDDWPLSYHFKTIDGRYHDAVLARFNFNDNRITGDDLFEMNQMDRDVTFNAYNIASRVEYRENE